MDKAAISFATPERFGLLAAITFNAVFGLIIIALFFGADKERKKKAGATKIIYGSRWRMAGNGRQRKAGQCGGKVLKWNGLNILIKRLTI